MRIHSFNRTIGKLNESHTYSVIHRRSFRRLVALLPSMTTDDANDDSCDVTIYDAIDGDANGNVHFSN